jgi:hypothetical protein
LSEAINAKIQGGHHYAWINQSNARLDTRCIRRGADIFRNTHGRSCAGDQHLRKKRTHQIGQWKLLIQAN